MPNILLKGNLDTLGVHTDREKATGRRHVVNHEEPSWERPNSWTHLEEDEKKTLVA